MSPRLPAQWSPPRRISRAAFALRAAPTSPCAACGHVSKTTTDGFCADCWARKEGDPGRGLRRPPRWALRLADLLTLRWLRR
jgi:hypothetical protein